MSPNFKIQQGNFRKRSPANMHHEYGYKTPVISNFIPITIPERKEFNQFKVNSNSR